MTLIDFLQRLQTTASSTQGSMADMGKTSKDSLMSVADGARAAEDALKRAEGAMRMAATASLSAFTAYNSYQSSLISLEDAQNRYNDAVAKYGRDSDEAARAANSLEKAQKASLNSMVSMGVATATAASSIYRAVQANQALLKANEDAGISSSFLQKNMTGLLMAGGMVAAIYMAMTAASDKMRLAYSALAGVMAFMIALKYKETIATWALNAAKAFGLTLTGAGAALVATAAAVTAGVVVAGATYVASSKANADAQTGLKDGVNTLATNAAKLEPGQVNVNIYVDTLTATPEQMEDLANQIADSVSRRSKLVAYR